MRDPIERQSAIDAVTDELDMIDHVPQWVFDRLEKRLKQLPSAQPEIIRCKDCKHYRPMTDQDDLCAYRGMQVFPDDYCSRAER